MIRIIISSIYWGVYNYISYLMHDYKENDISSNDIKKYLKNSKVKGQNHSKIVSSWEKLRYARLATDHHIINPVKIEGIKIDITRAKLQDIIKSGRFIIENLKK